MKRSIVAILAVLLCFTSVVGFCACNSSPEETFHESEEGTPSVEETTKSTEEESLPEEEATSEEEISLEDDTGADTFPEYETINGAEPDTLPEEETTNNSGDEPRPAVEYKDISDVDLYQQYYTLCIGPTKTYDYGSGWYEKDFDLSAGPAYYLIYADPGQDFDIPMFLVYTLGYHIQDFDLEVTLAEGDEKSLEVVSVDKYKALNGGPECPGITVRSLEPGVARVYIKLTYIPTGDSSTHQVVVVVRDS